MTEAHRTALHRTNNALKQSIDHLRSATIHASDMPRAVALKTEQPLREAFEALELAREKILMAMGEDCADEFRKGQ